MKHKYQKSLHVYEENSLEHFCNYFHQCLSQYKPHDYSEIVITCIGTDRSTGDCLGPLIGQKLKSYQLNGLIIFGTLFQPVHAVNLNNCIAQMKTLSRPLVIAIDAALGDRDHIGEINIKNQGLRPGSGVNKKLPYVGDMSITGIVNTYSDSDIFSLQSTRLGLVMEMANLISLGIIISLTQSMQFDMSHNVISLPASHFF